MNATDAAQPSGASSETYLHTPFLLVHQRLDVTRIGAFRPHALVQITPFLRTSGLLQALPAEELQSLLLLLTFVTDNGVIAPSVEQLADALKLRAGGMERRMQRLRGYVWQGQPLVTERTRETGLHTFSPASLLLGVHHEPPPDPLASVPVSSAAGGAAAGKAAVIAHSRDTYGRPRAQVEAEIARLNGWEYPFLSPSQKRQQAADTSSALQPAEPGQRAQTPPDPTSQETPEQAALRQQLRRVGMHDEAVASLLARFDADAIRQQLEWLPYRTPKNPARFLYAAIQHNYDMPPRLRNRQQFEAALHDSLPPPLEPPQASAPPP